MRTLTDRVTVSSGALRWQRQMNILFLNRIIGSWARCRTDLRRLLQHMEETWNHVWTQAGLRHQLLLSEPCTWSTVLFGCPQVEAWYKRCSHPTSRCAMKASAAPVWQRAVMPCDSSWPLSNCKQLASLWGEEGGFHHPHPLLPWSHWGKGGHGITQ